VVFHEDDEHCLDVTLGRLFGDLGAVRCPQRGCGAKQQAGGQEGSEQIAESIAIHGFSLRFGQFAILDLKIVTGDTKLIGEVKPAAREQSTSCQKIKLALVTAG
jgi:hypothetical protein